VGERKELDLKRDLKAVTSELAQLNRELANQTILLASQTGNSAPLIEAVDALRSAQELYSVETAPRENAEVQQALADTLLTLAFYLNPLKGGFFNGRVGFAYPHLSVSIIIAISVL